MSWKVGIGQLNIQYNGNDKKVKDYEKYERMIKTINKRFKTYGYERIKTSTFEPYDLYTEVKSSINRKEMIKVVDREGDVFVLRPDVTIPITKQLADNYTVLPHELKYYYVQDVFRRLQGDDERVESTQAGIEYFCESSPEVDAEVIALACHTLRDLGFQNITIEIGHAGFVQSLIEKANFNEREAKQLRELIQSKNIVELEPFLRKLEVEESLITSFTKIPMLYGDPYLVSERAREITQTETMDDTLAYLVEVYEVLKLYGLGDFIVMDLGLINHMGYYSDMIFQGFVEDFGRPVLMGGRYDGLGNEFGAELPAIGFASTVESLLEAMKAEQATWRTPLDLSIQYDEQNLQRSIAFANELRERNYTVSSAKHETKLSYARESIYQVKLTDNRYEFFYKEKSYTFDSFQQLLKLIREVKGGL